MRNKELFYSILSEYIFIGTTLYNYNKIYPENTIVFKDGETIDACLFLRRYDVATIVILETR